MDYKTAQQKLETFRDRVEQHNADPDPAGHLRHLVEAYGAIEDIVERFAGQSAIKVEMGGGQVAVYPNYIEAGYLSGRGLYAHQGYTQLLKIIGRVRRLAEDPMG